MQIDKKYDAIRIENAVRDALKCDYGAYGGLVSADLYRDNPLYALFFVVGALYRDKSQDSAIDMFISKWKSAFNSPDANSDDTISTYVHELRDLIDYLKSNS